MGQEAQKKDVRTQRKRQRRNISSAIRARIEKLELDALAGTQIAQTLQLEFGEDAPSVRTVQGIVRDLRRHDGSEPWCLLDSEPGEAEFVLPVLAALLARTEGRRDYVSKAEAAVISRLGPHTRGMDESSMYQLVRFFVRRMANGQSTRDLDAFLAFRPWLSHEAAAHYYLRVAVGHIPPPPALLVLDQQAMDIFLDFVAKPRPKPSSADERNWFVRLGEAVASSEGREELLTIAEELPRAADGEYAVGEVGEHAFGEEGVRNLALFRFDVELELWDRAEKKSG